MLSKSQIKLINSLQQKKYRDKHGLFIVEGKKSVVEFLDSKFELEYLFFTEGLGNKVKTESKKEFLISTSELKKISALKNPNKILAVFKTPKSKLIKENGLILALDNIQDPGNLGTIIRLCDWFGVTQLICSKNTVDFLNPKVVQASMGSLTRVNVIYTNLDFFLDNTSLPIFATLLKGENIYKKELPKNAIIIMGNEGSGVSDPILNFASELINIPHFGETKQTESLNVASATAIVLSEFKR